MFQWLIGDLRHPEQNVPSEGVGMPFQTLPFSLSKKTQQIKNPHRAIWVSSHYFMCGVCREAMIFFIILQGALQFTTFLLQLRSFWCNEQSALEIMIIIPNNGLGTEFFISHHFQVCYYFRGSYYFRMLLPMHLIFLLCTIPICILHNIYRIATGVNSVSFFF